MSNASPLGTILAWVPQPEASQTVEALPDGWLPCDGSTITKGPWIGGKTPDLNSIGAFLRGGTDDKVLEVEDDQVQDHEHEDSGHQHDCSASSTAAPHDHDYLQYNNKDQACAQSNCGHIMHSRTITQTTESASVSVSTSCSTSFLVFASVWTWAIIISKMIHYSALKAKMKSHSSGIGGVDSAARSGTETRPINMKVSYVMRCW